MKDQEKRILYFISIHTQQNENGIWEFTLLPLPFHSELRIEIEAFHKQVLDYLKQKNWKLAEPYWRQEITIH